MADWEFPLGKEYTFTTYLKQLPTKGHLAWEYNPLRNFRIDETMWEYRSGLYTQQELVDKYGYCYKVDDKKWYTDCTYTEQLDE
ncbi:MAG: hypothetical protein HUJ56_09725 [Erysipelotrichaceae bacterium]|nr:hypothetical protein [Erysipelotrichaceae bacterium]